MTAMTTSTSGADDLRAAVAEQTAGTPYSVVPTPDGFDLRIDLADARWYGLLGTAGRRKVVQHRVRLEESARRYSITDDHYDVHWTAAADPAAGQVPRLVASAEVTRFQGRVREVSFERTLGVDAETARPAVVVDYVFDSAQGHRLVREPAQRLGWRERMGDAQRIGMVAGIAGGGVAALVGVTIAVVAALRLL